jgi:hypothetical protein
MTLYIPGWDNKSFVFNSLVLFSCGLGSDHYSRCEQSMLSIWYIPLRSQDGAWVGVLVVVGPVALLMAWTYVRLSCWGPSRRDLLGLWLRVISFRSWQKLGLLPCRDGPGHKGCLILEWSGGQVEVRFWGTVPEHACIHPLYGGRVKVLLW